MADESSHYADAAAVVAQLREQLERELATHVAQLAARDVELDAARTAVARLEVTASELRAAALAAARAATAQANRVAALQDAMKCADEPRLSAAFTDASPALFLSVLARLAENGYAHEIVRYVDICKDARSNVQLWERVVDLPRFAVRGPAPFRRTRLIEWAEDGDVVRVREMLGYGANVDARDSWGRTALY